MAHLKYAFFFFLKHNDAHAIAFNTSIVADVFNYKSNSNSFYFQGNEKKCIISGNSLNPNHIMIYSLSIMSSE